MSIGKNSIQRAAAATKSAEEIKEKEEITEEALTPPAAEPEDTFDEIRDAKFRIVSLGKNDMASYLL